LDRSTIALDRAIQIAEVRLQSLGKEVGQELAIDPDATLGGSAGWVFFWNTKVYLDDGSISDALAGNGPLLVQRDTGKVERLPVDTALDGFSKLA